MTLQTFLADKPFGFLTEADMPTLISLDRFQKCLVRCGGGRFIASAQDVPHFIKTIERGGDYIRDVSIYKPEEE